MGDMNNNPNDGNELDNSQLTPENQGAPDINSDHSFISSPENQSGQSNWESEYKETPYEQSFVTEPEQTPVKKSKRGLIAAIILIAVVAAGSIFAFANRSTFANTIALMSKSPSEYYSSIEKKTFNNGIDSLIKSYDKYRTVYQDEINSGQALNTNIKVTVNPQFTGLIGLGDFKALEAKISSLSKGNNEKTSIGITYNDQSLVNMNTFINSETGELLANVPELSSAYLFLSLDDLMSSSGELADGYTYNSYMKEIQALINDDSLSPDSLNSLLKKYTAIVVDNIDNVKLEKGVNLKVSELSGTYNMLTAKLTKEDMNRITGAILNEAKEDEVLKALFVNLKAYTAEEYTQLIDDALTNLNSSDAADTADSDTIYMRVYVDKSGNIIGREFSSSENADKSASGGGYYLVHKGSKAGLNAWINDGEDTFDFTADGTVSVDGFTGSCVLNFMAYGDTNTYSFNIDVENAKLDAVKESLSGKFKITSPLLMGAEFVVDCKWAEQEQNTNFKVLYGGLEGAEVDITSTTEPYQDFEFPSSDETMYDAINDIYSYMSTADFEGLFSHIEDVTGLDLDSLINNMYYNSLY